MASLSKVTSRKRCMTMGISDYVSSHEVDGQYCADAYDRGTNKSSIVFDIMNHMDIDAGTAWLVVEALDAMEDLRG